VEMIQSPAPWSPSGTCWLKSSSRSGRTWKHPSSAAGPAGQSTTPGGGPRALRSRFQGGSHCPRARRIASITSSWAGLEIAARTFMGFLQHGHSSGFSRYVRNQSRPRPAPEPDEPRLVFFCDHHLAGPGGCAVFFDPAEGAADRGRDRSVAKDFFEEFGRCGDPHFGFLRLRCLNPDWLRSSSQRAALSQAIPGIDVTSACEVPQEICPPNYNYSPPQICILRKTSIPRFDHFKQTI
jgi:hypothetical protein